jgi:NAD(P)-dependent dehydrogenase (short-subunit alcohol dehydrogenase family)
VFGSSGAIGSEITSTLREDGVEVIETERGNSGKSSINLLDTNWIGSAIKAGPFHGVIWAQGLNISDTVHSFSSESTMSIFQSNVLFIAETLRDLIDSGCLTRPCRTVVVSSIWQQLSRSEKFSYSLSKSALHGLVRSCAIDLADHSIAINAVLPGIVDSPMTRANLTKEQIHEAEGRSLGGKLATTSQVSRVTSWLISEDSTGINGEFIKVDHGWSINSGL